jgi:hypothetical protein
VESLDLRGGDTEQGVPLLYETRAVFFTYIHPISFDMKDFFDGRK